MGAPGGARIGRLSRPAHWILECLLDDPTREWSGGELGRVNGIPIGRVYPVLARLEARGWLVSRWSSDEEQTRRRVYRLGASGARELRAAMTTVKGAPAFRAGVVSGGEA